MSISNVTRAVWRLVVVAAALGLLAGGAAVATPPGGKVEYAELAKGTVVEPVSIQTSGPSDFYVQVVTLETGAATGWHTHPGAEFSIVKSGAVTVFSGCTPRTFSAQVGDQPGQAFFIPGGTNHYVENKGKEPAEIYVTYTLPAGSTIRDDAPAPNC